MPDLENTLSPKINKLAYDVLTLSRNTLLVNLRFLDAALSQFIFVPAEEWTLATDGKHLVYDSKSILKQYAGEKESVTRDYLHVVFHCIFRHMYIHTLINHELWYLATDIAVEAMISELGIRAVTSNRQTMQSPVLSELKEKIKPLTAEKIYRYYLDFGISSGELTRLRNLFKADDHDIWYLPPEVQIEVKQSVQSSSDANDNSDSGSDFTSTAEESARGALEGMEQIWKSISERMQVDLETFSKQHGDSASGLIQNLNAVNREKYDYTAFLKKFAVRGEAMKINDDEFDYIFYTYGLKTYGNMPLIEPLEYKEVKRIREFVIAIDTSGSVEGELVQAFVQKTYNILKSTESFFSKINLHIIQCDAEIQEDVKIASQDEFDEYLKTMRIKGLGGTDFRPVFDRVDEMIRNKEFRNLKGLIYFTDGYGEFPSKKPDYETAFVFVDDSYENPEVPSWAIKLVLQKDEI